MINQPPEPSLDSESRLPKTVGDGLDRLAAIEAELEASQDQLPAEAVAGLRWKVEQVRQQIWLYLDRLESKRGK